MDARGVNTRKKKTIAQYKDNVIVIVLEECYYSGEKML